MTPCDRITDVKLLTATEVAAALRVSKITVYRLIHEGELNAVRVGNGFRIPVGAVHEFLGRGL